MSKILFTSVGRTDPIPTTNALDGPILHICRWYKPDKVYMFMSKEILENHNKDNRYCYCIEKLSEKLNMKIETVVIERPDLENVQRFDIFLNDYEDIINKIYDENDVDELLLNVSSGTPAMKSAIQCLGALSNGNIRLIQVKSPEHREEKFDRTLGSKDYDVEFFWDINEDNEQDCENRCEESQVQNFLVKIKKEIIVKHIDSFDYAAALRIAEEIKNNISEQAYTLIQIAYHRLQLNKSKVDSLLKKTDFDIMPVKTSDICKLFEYLLWLQIKQKREDYADFIRGITPALVNLFQLYLKEKCSLDVENELCRHDAKKNLYTLLESAMSEKAPDLLEELNKKYSSGYKDGFLKSEYLDIFISVRGDLAVAKNVHELRKIEQSVRNIAAHNISSVTDDWIKSKTGISTLGIMNKIKSITNSTIPKAKDNWNSYEEMNETIKKLL